MLDDPKESEQYLALNAYLCFCSAFGCYMGAMHAATVFCVFIDEMFYMGFVFWVAGMVLIALADFKVPTVLITRMLKTKGVTNAINCKGNTAGSKEH